jgi:hypothetical protein
MEPIIIRIIGDINTEIDSIGNSKIIKKEPQNAGSFFSALPNKISFSKSNCYPG